MEIVVLELQSLFDLAIQLYGSVEGAFILALENDLSITNDLEPGQVLQYNTANVINKQVVEYYRVNGIKPATAFEGEIEKVRIFSKEFLYQFA